MMLNQNNTIILIIDVQEKLTNAVFNKETVIKKAETLSKAAEILNIPVIFTEQYPQGLGETINSIKKNGTTYIKTAFNALEDFNLLEELNKYNKKQIIVFGIETHICVYQTVLALISNKFDVTVIKDACGSRNEFEYNSGLECMKDLGAKIKTTEIALFELLKTAKHPNFKEIQSLIK